MLSENMVNVAVARWLIGLGATNVKYKRGSEQGLDVSGYLQGKFVVVESKGETPNDSSKGHRFSQQQFRHHCHAQVFKALTLRKEYPNAEVLIASPDLDVIRRYLSKIDLRSFSIRAIWVNSEGKVLEDSTMFSGSESASENFYQDTMSLDEEFKQLFGESESEE